MLKVKRERIQNNNLEITLEGKKKGKVFFEVETNTAHKIEVFHIHHFGVITESVYLGSCTNDILVPLSSLIIITYTITLLIKKYRDSIEKSLYQYQNIAILGLTIFLISSWINILINLLHYNGIISTIENIINSTQFFSIITFPITGITSVLVIISSVVLMKKEGFLWKNMLGILLGILVITATITPELINRFLQSSTLIDIHNEKGIIRFILLFIETCNFTCLAYLECILLGTIIIGIKAAKYKPEYNKDFVIILGCKIKKDGTPTPLLKGRIDKAIEFAKMQKEYTNKDIIFIPSGGRGNDEIISEAESMKNYLVQEGIKEKNIIVENKSTNTYENIKYSYEIIKKKKKEANILISTTNYHVFRAGNIAYNQNIYLEGIGSKTKTYFWINAFIREFIATIYNEKRNHIKVLSIIMIICIIMILLLYISIIK